MTIRQSLKSLQLKLIHIAHPLRMRIKYSTQQKSSVPSATSSLKPRPVPIHGEYSTSRTLAHAFKRGVLEMNVLRGTQKQPAFHFAGPMPAPFEHILGGTVVLLRGPRISLAVVPPIAWWSTAEKDRQGLRVTLPSLDVTFARRVHCVSVELWLGDKCLSQSPEQVFPTFPTDEHETFTASLSGVSITFSGV